MEVRANLRRYSRDVRSLRRQWRERESGKQSLLLAILRSALNCISVCHMLCSYCDTVCIGSGLMYHLIYISTYICCGRKLFDVVCVCVSIFTGCYVVG